MPSVDVGTEEEQPVIVELTPGHPSGGEFTLLVTSAYRAEITDLLRDTGLRTAEVLDLSIPA